MARPRPARKLRRSAFRTWWRKVPTGIQLTTAVIGTVVAVVGLWWTISHTSPVATAVVDVAVVGSSIDADGRRVIFLEGSAAGFESPPWELLIIAREQLESGEAGEILLSSRVNLEPDGTWHSMVGAEALEGVSYLIQPVILRQGGSGAAPLEELRREGAEADIVERTFDPITFTPDD